MDKIDFKIIKILSEHARITWADLSSALNLSRPAAAERVKKLEEKGVIKGYTAVLSPEMLGIGVTAFIFIVISDYKKKKDFLNLVNEINEIQECHHIAGQEDFLLKVRCKCIADLDKLICEKLKSQDIVAKTHTNIVLSTDKETSILPVEFIEETCK